MKPKLEVVVPYAKPLIIGVGISTSTKSWGDCKQVDWPEPPVLQAQQPNGNVIITA